MPSHHERFSPAALSATLSAPHDLSTEVSLDPTPTPTTPAARISSRFPTFADGDMHPLDRALVSYHGSDSSPAVSITLPWNIFVSLLKDLACLNSSSSVPFFPHAALDTMASPSGATPDERSPGVEAPATHTPVDSLPTTTVDVSIYGPALSTPAAATAGSSLPQDIFTLHTAANAKRFEVESRFADLTAHVSDLDDGISAFKRRIQDVTDQRTPSVDKRSTLRHSHTELVSVRAMLLVYTVERICALPDTAHVSNLSHAFLIITTARRAPSLPPSSSFPSYTRVPDPKLSPRSCLHHRSTSSSIDPSPTPSSLQLYTIYGLQPPRNIAIPMALIAADILKHPPPRTTLSLTSLTDEVDKEVCKLLHHTASRLVSHLHSSNSTGAPCLPITWGPHAATMERR